MIKVSSPRSSPVQYVTPNAHSLYIIFYYNYCVGVALRAEQNIVNANENVIMLSYRLYCPIVLPL